MMSDLQSSLSFNQYDHVYPLFTLLITFSSLYFQLFMVLSALLLLILMLDCLFFSLLHIPSPFSELNILRGCICMRPSSDSTHSHTHGRLIKGIDPLNLCELQFVPAAHPVRGVGAHGAVCLCVCIVQLLEMKKTRVVNTFDKLWEAFNTLAAPATERNTHTHTHTNVRATSIHKDRPCTCR